MDKIVLDANVRQVSKKQDLKTLRAEGRIPAELYGAKEKNISLSVDSKTFEKLLAKGAGSNMLIYLKVDGKEKITLVKDVQRDMISQKPIHIDFQVISLKEKIEVKVHLHIVGKAPGVEVSGGILEHILRDIDVKCLPTNIPKSIDVDVSNLEIGHSITVKDIVAPQGVEILADPKTIVVNIVAPTILEEPTPEAVAAEAAAGPAEPEVISKGKKDKEGEEGAAVEESPAKPAK